MGDILCYNLTMDIKKGAYRFVVFTPKYVFKIPTPRYAWGVLKNIPRMLKNGDGKFIYKELSWGLKNMLRGVRENKSEYSCWKRMQSPFLSKTFFSFFGILNIQARQTGDSPNREALLEMFLKLPQEAQKQLQQVESHCLEPANFINTNRGLILVDYDDGTRSKDQRLPFTVFLERWHKELRELLIPRVK